MIYPEHLFATIDHTLANKRVVVRIDLNTPLGADGLPVDTARIDAAIATLKLLSGVGARVIALSHYGEKGESLEPLSSYLSTKLPRISFFKSIVREEIESFIDAHGPGDIILLENTRLFPGETECESGLAMWFSFLGDIFINDAFPVSHRNHASVTGITRHALSYFGPHMRRELEGLEKALSPEYPCLLILGGAKLSTKLPLIETYLKKGCFVYVGGAMAHNILLARGFPIGDSLYDKEFTVSDYVKTHEKLILPKDVVCDDGETYDLDHIGKERKIYDCGPKTIEMLKETITHARTVVMNGPIGYYEGGFSAGTQMVLAHLGSQTTLTTIIGGGDTLTVLHSMNQHPEFTFVSLGGGAMLEYLQTGTLVGIEAVVKSHASL